MISTKPEARYFDGEQIKPHTVRLLQEPQLLIGKNAFNERMFRWRLEDIYIKDAPIAGHDITLCNKLYPDARLLLNEEAWEIINPLIDVQNRRAKHQVGLKSNHILYWVSGAVAVMVGMYILIPILAGPIANLISKEMENQLGDYAIEQLAGKAPICSNASGISALQKIENRIRRYNPTVPDIYVKVIESDIVNAFAAPGNNVVFFSGFIEEAENPEEVAGVLAHEMGHVLKRHALEGMIRDLGLIFLFETMLGGTGEFAAVLLTLDFGREDENEADAIALELMKNADINPQGMANFFIRASGEEEMNEDVKELFSYLSTHPLSEERVENIISAPNNKNFRPVLSEEEWQALKNICDKQ